MQLAVIAIGRLRSKPLRELMDDYLGRISRYARVEEVELKDKPERTLEERLMRAVESRGEAVLLDPSGKRMTSHAFASWVGDAEDAGQKLSFLVGGSDGFPPAVARRARHRICLSEMTMPHQLARVVLAEQVYRAFTILRGEPYSH